MQSVRRGLREGSISKDTYERLNCSECDQELKKKDDPDEVFSVRICPECGREWKDLR
ncbi:MAG: HVO_0758 family zinc finger protein [Haloferacaceae archaeon]